MKKIVKEEAEPPAVRRWLMTLINKMYYKYKFLKYGKA